MISNRIYGEKIDINTEKIENLYNKRAENVSNMKSIYTSVLLGDQNSDYADEWNKVEKDMIIPFLKADSNSVVWDLGCGIGRWGEILMPLCSSYTGVDFSEGMIKIACERCTDYINNEKKFIRNSVQRFLADAEKQARPDVIIVSYVCMYINDSELKEVMRKLADLAAEKCVIYFIDTVAIEKRLTLNGIYSSALKSEYSALYRTVDEYNTFYEPLVNAGFEKKFCDYMPKLNNEEQYSETDRYCTVFERM